MQKFGEAGKRHHWCTYDLLIFIIDKFSLATVCITNTLPIIGKMQQSSVKNPNFYLQFIFKKDSSMAGRSMTDFPINVL